MKIFEPERIGTLTLPNRIIRSATFEGMADPDGFPSDACARCYETLARQGIGAIVTGFAFIRKTGKAMQPGQTGIDHDDKIPAWSAITRRVHDLGGRIVMQIAHAGRQTIPSATGGRVYGPTTASSPYFRSHPEALDEKGTTTIIDDFGQAALRAMKAGFDGVELHAAHGYLIHQFINPAINNRADAFGTDPALGIGTEFLRRVITESRRQCGPTFPLLVKVSAGDEYRNGINRARFVNLISFLGAQQIDAIEVSWGTMDHALNIFRGTSIPADLVLRYNPRYKTGNPLTRAIWRSMILPCLRLTVKPFTPAYNLPFAALAKRHTKLPVISVGGFRSATAIERAVHNGQTDFVSLCRPFIREPDLAARWRKDPAYCSTCTSCNRCAVMCDSGNPTRCYRK